MANRSRMQTERVIGPVANTTIIRTRLDADLSFLEALSRVRETVLEAYARQELPFEILTARLADEGRLDPGSLLQVFFVLQNAFRGPLELPDVALRPFANLNGQPAMGNRFHVALADAQGDILRHYRRMLLQEGLVQAKHPPTLDRGLQDDLGQSGRKPRDTARPVG